MTQANIVWKHLTNRGPMTSVEAIGLYGITRLAAVVNRLRKRGKNITTVMKPGVHGTYAEYKLAPKEPKPIRLWSHFATCKVCKDTSMTVYTDGHENCNHCHYESTP